MVVRVPGDGAEARLYPDSLLGVGLSCIYSLPASQPDDEARGGRGTQGPSCRFSAPTPTAWASAGPGAHGVLLAEGPAQASAQGARGASEDWGSEKPRGGR